MRKLNVPCPGSVNGRHKWRLGESGGPECQACEITYTEWYRRSVARFRAAGTENIRRRAFMAGAAWRGSQDGYVSYGDIEFAAQWYAIDQRADDVEANRGGAA